MSVAVAAFYTFAVMSSEPRVRWLSGNKIIRVCRDFDSTQNLNFLGGRACQHTYIHAWQRADGPTAVDPPRCVGLCFSHAQCFLDRVDIKLLEEVQEYDAVPSEAASYGENAFWDERYAADEEVRTPVVSHSQSE